MMLNKVEFQKSSLQIQGCTKWNKTLINVTDCACFFCLEFDGGIAAVKRTHSYTAFGFTISATKSTEHTESLASHCDLDMNMQSFMLSKFCQKKKKKCLFYILFGFYWMRLIF